MSIARVFSAQPSYLEALPVTVETDISKGVHSFHVVGLGDKSIDESRERVSAAIKNSGLGSLQHSNKKVLVSLAPADMKKEGPRFDLPIALSYLIASKSISFNTQGILFMGELSLQGDIRPVRGILSIASYARTKNFHTVVVPALNAAEAALIPNITVIAARSLADVVGHFTQTESIPHKPITPHPQTTNPPVTTDHSVDFGDICGQETAKRGLEIAAAGRHNIALYGPPGTGKTMLARALRGILPSLSFEESLEATTIHSVAGQLRNTPFIYTPPFRSPHHSASHVSIVGGGSIPRPGEVTLAHRGVLFLDEFPEFDRRVIDGLREPLEDRVISVTRAQGSVTFPANFILVAALNPNRERGNERISDLDRERLKKKISGPVIDRIDLWLEVTHIDHEKLRTHPETTNQMSSRIRDAVVTARTVQHTRYKNPMKTNADMSVRDIHTHANISESAEQTLLRASKQYNLSPRSYHRSLKVARTIADLEGSPFIEEAHVLESLAYRPKDLFGI